MKCLLLIPLMTCCLVVSGPARSAQSAEPSPETAPGLLPTAVARPLLDQHPLVQAARAELDAARQEAQQVAGSPHEWTVRMLGQRRSLDNGLGYNEWNAGVERGWRLPAKGEADRKLGDATAEHGQALYGEALHEAARELLGLWLTWVGAEHARELAGQNAAAAESAVAAVEKRMRAGDASRLDLGLARGEWLEQRRLANEALTQARVAWSRLSTRFAGVPHQVLPLPDPPQLPSGRDAWIQRIQDQSDEIKIALTDAARAQAHALRAQADRSPDPTVGVFYGTEAAGRERIAGLTLSIPLSGDQRSRQADRSVALAEAARWNADARRQEVLGEIRAAFDHAQGSYDSWRLAQDNAAAMADSARLVQRAYELGEADLQTLLLSNRQATQAAQTALDAKVAAVRAYESLRVDAHWVWDLDHEDSR